MLLMAHMQTFQLFGLTWCEQKTELHVSVISSASSVSVFLLAAGIEIPKVSTANQLDIATTST